MKITTQLGAKAGFKVPNDSKSEKSICNILIQMFNMNGNCFQKILILFSDK